MVIPEAKITARATNNTPNTTFVLISIMTPSAMNTAMTRTPKKTVKLPYLCFFHGIDPISFQYLIYIIMISLLYKIVNELTEHFNI